jgi:hypothetical protein
MLESGKDAISLGDYLNKEIFAGNKGEKLAASKEETEGFDKFMELYLKGLNMEKEAVKLFEA